MDVIAAYQQVGTYRGAAVMCGTTHKTVKRMVGRAGWELVRTLGRELSLRHFSGVAWP